MNDESLIFNMKISRKEEEEKIDYDLVELWADGTLALNEYAYVILSVPEARSLVKALEKWIEEQS